MYILKASALRLYLIQVLLVCMKYNKVTPLQTASVHKDVISYVLNWQINFFSKKYILRTFPFSVYRDTQ